MPAADLDDILGALADPTRRAIVDLLRKRPRTPGELAAALGASAPATSRHLRVLRTRGLIDEERVEDDARVKRIRLRRDPFVRLQAWLDQVEAFWRDQLGAFRAHAERKGRRR